jgi:elongator complex protein 3
MADHGWTCDCIRCREVGMNDQAPGDVEPDVTTYEAAGGTEHFISYEDPDNNLLIGFCRLRFPGNPQRAELREAALVRELHVYGPMVEVSEARSASETSSGDEPRDGDESYEWQHKGYGRKLLRKAEALAADAGYEKVSVISGIGAREYYREKLGYHQDGPYVSKRL